MNTSSDRARAGDLPRYVGHASSNVVMCEVTSDSECMDLLRRAVGASCVFVNSSWD